MEEEPAEWWNSKALQIQLPFKVSAPPDIPAWFAAIWNCDIFIAEVPFLKTILLLNLVYCIILKLIW